MRHIQVPALSRSTGNLNVLHTYTYVCMYVYIYIYIYYIIHVYAYSRPQASRSKVYSREFLNSEAEPIKANEACGSFVVGEQMWGTAIFHLS